jgi:hypothetical protein
VAITVSVFTSKPRTRSPFWFTHKRRPRPMVCRRQRSVSRVLKLQIWKTLGLSQPSFSAEWLKMNFSGDSKPSSFSLSRMIRL